MRDTEEVDGSSAHVKPDATQDIQQETFFQKMPSYGTPGITAWNALGLMRKYSSPDDPLERFSI